MRKFNLKNIQNCLFILGICVSSQLFAQSEIFDVTAQSKVNTQAIILKNLNYKTLFMQFHQKDIRLLKMKDTNMDQAVGLKDQAGEIEYAVMNDVISYKNLQGEMRYIVYIERFKQEDGEINTGHPARPIVELYLFKRLANGQYQLLSQTRPDLDILGSWGESHLNAEDFAKVQQVGTNQQGVFYGGGYTSTGSHTEVEFMIVLNESGWIEQYPFGIQEDNSGMYENKDPQYASYGKEYSLIKNSKIEGLYPLQIQYTKEGTASWVKGLPKNGFKEIVKFNTQKNCFLHDNGRCNQDISDE